MFIALFTKVLNSQRNSTEGVLLSYPFKSLVYSTSLDKGSSSITTIIMFRKRIKQNLSNIDFEEDSDKDSDWEEK